jgi:alpha/beta superfamily hydrolase
MRRPEIEGFISIAPPANMYDFSFLAPCPSSGIIIQGDEDSIVPEDAAGKLAAKLDGQKNISVDYEVINGADHFFREKLNLLEDTCNKYIIKRSTELKEKPKIKPDRRRRQLPRT